MEDKISRLVTTLVGGSVLVVGFCFILAMAMQALQSGELLGNLFIVKWPAIGAAYLGSVLIVATLPGKPATRRAASWSVSIVFHTGLLLYLGLSSELGSIVFLVGAVETAIIALSIVWLLALIVSERRSGAA